MQAPRFLISAAHKSSGKTVISTGLAAAFAARGLALGTFKKGPDYIDPMWLSAASGRVCYNLDYNIMDADEISSFFPSRASGALNLIEANKGLFDGIAIDGSDSNAALAKHLDLPVVLVIDCNGMTRGIAPLLMGYQAFDAQVNIAGVILNKVGGARHEAKLRAAVAEYTTIPVIGAVHRNKALEIGERHLGLTTPAESGEFDAMIARIGEIVGASVDLDALQAIAATAPPLAPPTVAAPAPKPDLRIAIARDQAFGFYYPDDLEAFAAAGAALVPFNTLRDSALPEDIDGLFIGGGFPEMFISELAGNHPLLKDIGGRIKAGLPVYAECGGLMYLCRSIVHGEARGAMVGAIAADAVMHPRPQGRGYAEFASLPAHPWARAENQKAHEFHYARLENPAPNMVYTRKITRGHGIDGQFDGVLVGNALAGFIHQRTSPSNPWVADFVAFVRAQKTKSERKKPR
ncbi:MAG TPA: cobyrinate a,c-diamide synthase [Rhodobacterales bacterium]|nr:cobyrinate a,c-diamide synthase [Rhodobacterales bacterium]